MEEDFVYNGLDHVQLAAPPGSEQAYREFFVEVLGMEEIEKPDNLRRRVGVWFKCGSNQIHIGIESNFKPAKKAHPAISVMNIDRLKERIISKGLSIREEEPLPGAKRFYLDDPFGNRLEFLEWI